MGGGGGGGRGRGKIEPVHSFALCKPTAKTKSTPIAKALDIAFIYIKVNVEITR